MTKQERRHKASKRAAEQAETVVATAVDSAVAAVATKPKRGSLPAEHAALADQVKELREGGLAWWQIGFKLSLPGSADTVAKGKGGAAYARKIWKSAFGEVPRVQNRTGLRSKKREKNDHVRELKETTKAARVEAVRRGEAVIRPEMTDEEIVTMLEGRVIVWSFNLANVDGQSDDFFDCEIGVFPKTCKVTGEGEERAVHFNELDPKAPIAVRGIKGAYRSVRVSAIHTVK